MWDHPNPIFLDYETQSFADIKDVGGRLYAYHPSTRILILSMCIDDVFHVWIPDHIRCNIPAHAKLWPNELKPAKEVRLYRGTEIPVTITDAIFDVDGNLRPLAAHNAYGFDRFIWERFHASRPRWLDTLYLARISGRHGKLDTLAKSLLGTGKDRAKKLLPLLTTAKGSTLGKNKWTYPVINPGDLAAFISYAIADVELMIRLWKEFESLDVEADVIDAHNTINDRGVAVDEDLIDLVEQVSLYSVAEASKEIARLTRGVLNENNIRSTQQVHAWVQQWGISIVDDAGKLCLRKEVVQRYINSPYIIEENLTSATEIPPVVIQVLQLRMKALRITDAKVKRAKQRVHNGRIYDLHTYHQAHTGRASSQGVQIHNLPRPPKGLKIDSLLTSIQSDNFKAIRNDAKASFDFIKASIHDLPELTVDDVCSALIRPSFKAKDGYKLVLCDFSVVEPRTLSWIADEEKLMAVFHRQDKGLSKFGPYEDFAARMFGIPLDKVDTYQRQVAKSAVLGCGYGLGPDKFRVYAAAMGADLVKAGVTAESVIGLFRDTYTKIAGFKPDKEANFRTNGIWHKLEKAVKECVDTRVPQVAGKCRWMMQEKDLLCILPSGRIIHYPDARIEDVVPAYCYSLGLPLVPKSSVVYTSTRGPKSLYGGLLTENVVQAIARDLLYNAILDCEVEQLPVVLHVHDEPVCEVEDSRAEQALRDMVRIMSTTPSWAPGLPLACEGFISPRFVKKAFKGYTEMSSVELNKCNTSAVNNV